MGEKYNKTKKLTEYIGYSDQSPGQGELAPGRETKVWEETKRWILEANDGNTCMGVENNQLRRRIEYKECRID